MKHLVRSFSFIFTLLLFNLSVPVSSAESGICSYYQGGGFTANGERFYDQGMTAAHKTLPFNSMVRVFGNGNSVLVRINDRGPFVSGRILDLSLGAARKLGMIRKGIIKCTIEPETSNKLNFKSILFPIYN